MLQLGKLHVQRVVDMEDVQLPTERGFPDLTPAMLREHARRLGPRMVDPATLNLLLSFHTYVVRTGELTILVDTCIGNDKHRPKRPDWHGRQGDFLDRLLAAGVRPEDVDVVMCTHLHADHVGWNTRLVDGRWVPTFPNARYIMAAAEYRALLEQVQRDGPGAFHGCHADSVLPVVDSGQAEMVGLEYRVAPGIHTEGVPGHTPGSVLIHLEDDGAHGICTGDLIHHPFQLACPGMHTQYCTDPAQAAARRMAFCERYADTASRVLTAHFPAPSSGRIVRDGAAYNFVFDES
jgi:glyoxylase-like metal-dependent hydrolase (beta-lactamase superfamily II)